MAYSCYSANYWKLNPEWPNGLEPDGRGNPRRICSLVSTEEEARAICDKWNAAHKPGKLKRRATYREVKNKVAKTDYYSAMRLFHIICIKKTIYCGANY